MKIGIFGGSFNPIHNDHIKIVDEILKNKIVNQVWFLPCKHHAFGKNLASEKDRLKMIKLAINKRKNVKINTIEFEENKKNYSVETIRKLKKKYNHKFYLIIGADILEWIDKWYKFDELKNEVSFIIISRKGYKIKKVEGLKIEKILDVKSKGISSTLIRENILEDNKIENLVPKSVYLYIKQRRIYNG